VEASYTPVFQSGSTFDLRVGQAESSSSELSLSTIIYSLGSRFKHYCADLARTLFVEPSAAVQEDYEALLAAQTAAIEVLFLLILLFGLCRVIFILGTQTWRAFLGSLQGRK